MYSLLILIVPVVGKTAPLLTGTEELNVVIAALNVVEAVLK